MKLKVENKLVGSDPGPEQIAEALASLDGDKATYAILERGRMTYMQTSGSVADGFDLEYQEGSLERHYYCPDSLSLEEVTKAFQSYAKGEGEWQVACKWEDEAQHKKNTPRIPPTRQAAWALLIFSLVWGGLVLGASLHTLASGRAHFGGRGHGPSDFASPDRNPTLYWAIVAGSALVGVAAIGAGVVSSSGTGGASGAETLRERKRDNHCIIPPNEHARTAMKRFLLFVAALVGAVVILGFIPLGRSKALPNGAMVRITHPPIWLSLWAFVFNTNWWPHCTITYEPKPRPSQKIVFWEDFADKPFEVFLSSDGHSLLCLYDYDTSAPLFKFDTDKPFDPSIVTYNIKRLVCTSPWEVREASLADWQEVQGDLTTQHISSGWIGGSVSRSIQNIKDGQPPVPYAGERPKP